MITLVLLNLMLILVIDICFLLLIPFPSISFLVPSISFLFSLSFRYAWLCTFPSQHSHLLVRALSVIFDEFGCPQILQSDNGGPFISDVICQLAEERGVTLRHSLPRKPRVQGQVEKLNDTIKSSIRNIAAERKRGAYIEEEMNDYDIAHQRSVVQHTKKVGDKCYSLFHYMHQNICLPKCSTLYGQRWVISARNSVKVILIFMLLSSLFLSDLQSHSETSHSSLSHACSFRC